MGVEADEFLLTGTALIAVLVVLVKDVPEGVVIMDPGGNIAGRCF